MPVIKGLETVEVFKMAKSIISENDMQPISLLFSKEGISKLEDCFGNEFVDYLEKDTIKKTLESANIPMEKIYITSHQTERFCYYDGKFVFLGFIDISPQMFELLKVKERIESTSKYMENLQRENDYEGIFFVLDNKVAALSYIKHFDIIPEKDKYNIFEHIYTTSEYGFEIFSRDFILEAVKYFPRENLNAINEYIDADGNITIYRGSNSESSEIETALSWTLKRDIAYFFANRYDGEGTIYQAKIKPENILAYIDSSESEILTFYDNIFDLDIVEKIPAKLGIQNISKFDYYEDALKLYNKGLSRFIMPEKLFSSSMHGLLHCKRVLFASCILASHYSLSIRDSNILSFCAMLHDIGRDNDDEDNIHGIKSWDFIKNIYIHNSLNEADREISRFIIENHCIDDEKAIKNICNYKIRNKKRAINLLKLLKDADALDRVRYGDDALDINYLRFDMSKSLVKLSKEMLLYLK